MAKTPALRGLLAGCLLLAGVSHLQAQPTVDQMLTFVPKQKDVTITTPTADEHTTCKVELVKGTRQGASGWALVDGNGKKLRLFFDTNGDKQIDMWSYYRDGVEVYREIDSNFNAKADQYRWLNAGGMKWGVAQAEDGKINAWRMISAEEAGQEAFLAISTHDFGRLKALFLTQAEMTALKLSAKDVQRITALQQKAAGKFAEVAGKLPQLARATFVRVEGSAPGCALAEHHGGESDLIKYSGRSVLYQTEAPDATGKKEAKHEWLGLGEMIQVGLAWRLVDAPGPEDGPTDEKLTPRGNPRLTPLLDKLAEIDKKQNQTQANPPTPAQVKETDAYLAERIKLVKDILPLVDAKDHDTWCKQLCDNLAAKAQNGDTTALKQLTELTTSLAKQAPGSNLAAYGSLREISSRFTLESSLTKDGKLLADIQAKWQAQLEEFVKIYPTSEDTTPEALWQLALGNEFNGKDQIARRYYLQLHQGFPKHVIAEKARGCDTRLDLVGKEMKLAGDQLNGNRFDIASLTQNKKLVVVYYWQSQCAQCLGDFARMKKLYEEDAAKLNLEFVCVNLDDTAAEANRFLKSTPVPGIHLFSNAPNAMGLNSQLAVQYGINGLPTMFLVGRDGRVVNNRLQINELETELKKAN